MTKKSTKHKHAKERALERHELSLSQKDIQSILTRIIKGDLKGVQEGNKGYFKFTFAGRQLRIVYDYITETICTIY